MATADRLLAPGPRPHDMFLTGVLSILLHALVVAVVLIVPRFQVGTYITVPVSYTVDLIGGEPGGRSREGAPAPRPATPAPAAPAKVAPAPPVRSTPPSRPSEELTLPGRSAKKAPTTESPLRPAPIAKAEPTRTASAAPVAPASAPPAPAAQPSTGQVGARGSGAEVASGAGTGSGGGTALAYYLTLVDRKIDENWDRLGGAAGQEVVVRFRVLASGQVRDVELEASSGNSGLDASALRAIRQSTPLPPFPNLLTESSLNLRYRFVLER
ncbi:MAG TPA: energy transducer TonB [Candidatus Baltobacteraceae bacterium]|nr:energy transducer TonB [Candidatus Baltobacteraceae bacterium]